MPRWYLLLSLLLSALSAVAAPAHEWFVLRLDDRQIGFIERSREVEGSEVRTREYFRARFNRNGVPLTVTTEEKHRETLDGRPLRFSYRQKLGQAETRMSGELLDRQRMRLRVRFGNSTTQRMVSWPDDALMMEGVRLREREMLQFPGKIVRYVAFGPASLEGVRTQARVTGYENLEVDGRTYRAARIEHVLAIAHADVRAVAYVDETGALLRTTLPLFGREFTIERASEHLATQPTPRADIYDFTLVSAPMPLNAALKRQDLRYRIRFEANDQGRGLPSAGQDWLAFGKGQFDLTVRVGGIGAQKDLAPSPQDLASTTWINSDDHAIRRFAELATIGVRSAAERVRRLEDAVRRRINNKSLRVGYASATDAFARREGDCTEHALLLAAAIRSVGIPARIAIGLVYAEQFGTRERVFVPHAWTQAWVEGRWLGVDAALEGYGSGHIALATGDGDPSDYYAGLERIGTMMIDEIAVAPASP